MGAKIHLQDVFFTDGRLEGNSPDDDHDHVIVYGPLQMQTETDGDVEGTIVSPEKHRGKKVAVHITGDTGICTFVF